MIARIRIALGGTLIGVALFILTTLPSYAQMESTPSDASVGPMTGTMASVVQRPVQEETQKNMGSLNSATPMTGTMPMSGTMPMGQTMPMGDADFTQMMPMMMQMMDMMGSQMGMTMPLSGTMPMSGTMSMGDADISQMMPKMMQMMQMMAGNMGAMPTDGMGPMGAMNSVAMAQRLQVMGIMMQMMGQTMQSMNGGQSMDFAPLVNGLYDGDTVQFLHTEVSDPGIAQILTDMMGPQVVVVPELAETPESLLANVYVFANGIEDGGPLGFQRDIFDAVPGDENYRPLRSINLVTWQEGVTARELGSVEELKDAESAGEVMIEQPGIVVNMPMMAWPGGQR